MLVHAAGKPAQNTDRTGKYGAGAALASASAGLHAYAAAAAAPHSSAKGESILLPPGSFSDLA